MQPAKFSRSLNGALSTRWFHEFPCNLEHSVLGFHSRNANPLNHTSGKSNGRGSVPAMVDIKDSLKIGGPGITAVEGNDPRGMNTEPILRYLLSDIGPSGINFSTLPFIQ